MLNFFEKLEDKIAFKRAIKEVEEESAKTTRSGTVTRVYHNNEFSSPLPKTKVKPFGGDEVDTKYFKDWRYEDSLEPGVHETYFTDEITGHKENKNKIYDFDLEEKQGENGDVDKPADDKDSQSDAEFKKSIFEGIDKNNDLKRNDLKSFPDYKSYFAAKLKEKLNKTFDSDKADIKEEKNNEKSSSVAAVATTQVVESEQSKQDREEIKDKLDQIIQSLRKKPDEETQKVAEPVVQVKKSTTKRKTRGKGKRKFDADVITNVDWRD